MNDEQQVDDGSAYPPPDVLDQWSVPEMPSDMKERVMNRVEAHDGMWSAPVGAVSRTKARRWWDGGRFASVAAIGGFAAAAAALVIALQRPSEPVVGPGPAPAVAVVASPVNDARGHLTLDVTPIDATVELDGLPLEGPPPYVATNLPPGRHTIAVKRDGYVTWSRAIDVPAGQLHLPVGLVDAQVAEQEVRKPRSTATLASEAAVKVEGSLDREAIRRVIRAHIGEIETCYNAGLERDKTLAGKVTLELQIGSDGRVSDAFISHSTLADIEVDKCIAEAATSWAFPRPQGGNVSVSYPFVLTAE